MTGQRFKHPLLSKKKNGEPYYTPFKDANEHIFVLTDTAYF